MPTNREILPGRPDLLAASVDIPLCNNKNGVLPLVPRVGPFSSKGSAAMKAALKTFVHDTKRIALLALLALTCCLRSLPAAELDEAKLAQIGPAMQKFVDQKDLAGAVAVVGRHDKVVATAVVGFQNLADKTPMQADTLFRIASMTKPITAVGVMILVDEGKLKIDDPVEKHLPEFHGQKLRTKDPDGGTRLVEPARLVTIRDLMTHTSGMAGGLPREPANLYIKRDHTLTDAVKLFAKEPLDFQPGAKWQYCNTGIDTLGRLVEVGSGQSFETFMQKRVFDPLGMKDTTFYPTPAQAKRLAVTYGVEKGELVASKGDIIGVPPGAKYPIPAGGLCSTGPDIARFYRMMLNGGTLDGRRILSPESVKTMTTLQTGEIVCGFTSGMGFGLGFAVVRQPQGVTAMLSPGAFGHGGAFGTQSWADPKQDLILIMLIQRTGLPNGDASTMRQEFQKIAVGALK
jgi:CubicO group peptidase (beta-lactamase class C family)